MLDVQHVPDIAMSIELSFLPVRTKVTPLCIVTSSPLSTVEWYKDGNKMQETGFAVDSGDTTVTHKLPLKEMGSRDEADDTWVVDEERLGVYECRAKNYLGEASGAVEIFKSCDRNGGRCFKVKKENEDH